MTSAETGVDGSRLYCTLSLLTATTLSCYSTHRTVVLSCPPRGGLLCIISRRNAHTFNKFVAACIVRGSGYPEWVRHSVTAALAHVEPGRQHGRQLPLTVSFVAACMMRGSGHLEPVCHSVAAALSHVGPGGQHGRQGEGGARGGDDAWLRASADPRRRRPHLSPGGFMSCCLV